MRPLNNRFIIHNTLFFFFFLHLIPFMFVHTALMIKYNFLRDLGTGNGKSFKKYIIIIIIM